MVFITRSSKKMSLPHPTDHPPIHPLASAIHSMQWRMAASWILCLLVGFLLQSTAALAEGAAQEVPQLRFIQDEQNVLMMAQTKFDLTPAIEESLYKGVALTFVADLEVVRERWYWTNKKVIESQRRMRLSYQTLTRKWRVQALAENSNSGTGIQMPLLFDQLSEALSAIQRISAWPLIATSEIDPSSKYTAEFRFKLDVTQLPRPLQIGLIGHNDWLISMSKRQAFMLEPK